MPISSILINFILFMALGWLLRNKTSFLKVFGKFIRGVLLLCLGWLLFSAIGYLITPLFFDHSEASIASVGAYWWTGHALYTTLDDPHRYSLLYGPWPYMVAAWFQTLGSGTIFLSKLPGVLNLFALLAAVAFLAKDLPASRFSKVLAVSGMSAVLVGFYNFSYWIRPDSYLITYVFIGFLIVSKRQIIPSWFAYISIAVLAGLAANCKAHGVIYFLPLAAYYWESQKGHFSILKVIMALAVFFAVFFFPFFLPNISFENYLEWLKMASRHGLQFSEFSKNITFIAAFLLLLWLAGFAREAKYTFYVLCAVSFLAAVAGSKAGAGNNHLIPLLPVILWLAIEKYFSLPPADQKRASIVVGAFALTLALNGVNRQKRIQQLLKETSMRTEEFADLKDLVGRTDGELEMGYTNLESYFSTFYKPWLVRKDGHLLLDGASLMDLSASDISIPSSTIKVISACEIKYFIFPKNGEPWSLQSFYEGHVLFSDEFKKAFAEKYKKVDESAHFQLYSCVAK